MNYPKFGSVQVICGKRRCGWTGLETDMEDRPHPTMNNATLAACPKCGSTNGYFFADDLEEE